LSIWAKALPAKSAEALMALTELNGPCAQVLENAKRILPKHKRIDDALAQLEKLATATVGLPSDIDLSIDLADLRGYQYHSGVMFAAYVDKLPQPIARGGRYDHVGQAFGRPRPATGFSMDLLTLASLAPMPQRKSAIVAPWINDAALASKIMELRLSGEVLIQAMAGDTVETAEYLCDRELVRQGSSWEVIKK
jgi:ATP phosphoribosyltransferase regulatory subunit